MFRQTVLATTLVVALTPPGAHAAPALPAPLAGLPASVPATALDNADLAQIRAQLQQMKQEYEARIQALEKRLLASESATARTDAPASRSRRIISLPIV